MVPIVSFYCLFADYYRDGGVNRHTADPSEPVRGGGVPRCTAAKQAVILPLYVEKLATGVLCPS